jgi:hypothetical protein
MSELSKYNSSNPVISSNFESKKRKKVLKPPTVEGTYRNRNACVIRVIDI